MLYIYQLFSLILLFLGDLDCLCQVFFLSHVHKFFMNQTQIRQSKIQLKFNVSQSIAFLAFPCQPALPVTLQVYSVHQIILLSCRAIGLSSSPTASKVSDHI